MGIYANVCLVRIGQLVPDRLKCRAILKYVAVIAAV
jgi:hypothetical protein